MRKAHSASRRYLLGAVVLGAAVASLAFAGVANANVFPVTGPDEPVFASCPTAAPTSSTLSTQIANANAATSSASNTITLVPGTYCPILAAGTTTTTITHNLTIVADHSFQGTTNSPNIVVQGLDSTAGPVFTVAPGVTLTLEGFDFDVAGQAGQGAIANNGTLVAWGMSFDGNLSPAIVNAGPGGPTATVQITDSQLSDDTGIAFENENQGTVNLDNDTFTNTVGNAMSLSSTGTVNAFNTLVAGNAGLGSGTPECTGGGTFSTESVGNVSDDQSCGTAAEVTSSSTVDNNIGAINPTVPDTGVVSMNGGPSSSTALEPNTDTTLKGVSAHCPLVDQRFFVNPVVNGTVECDVGSVTGSLTAGNGSAAAPNSATQETASPTCTVTGGTPSVSQNVTLNDLSSGIGPEPGLGTDNPTNVISTTYPTQATLPVPVFGYAVDNLQIDNGSVTFTAPTSPTTAGLVLTAGNKTVAGTNNAHWSFTGLNWAGVAKTCV